jgi:transposase
LPRTVAHPFYEQLNRLLEERSFDEWVERQCTRFYAERMGRPSLAPGRYFRMLLIGYFEGIDSERRIAWRAADSLALRSFLGAGLNEMPPDHSTISRTRRLIDVETHQAVFRWVLELLAEKGLLKVINHFSLATKRRTIHSEWPVIGANGVSNFPLSKHVHRSHLSYPPRAVSSLLLGLTAAVCSLISIAGTMLVRLPEERNRRLWVGFLERAVFETKHFRSRLLLTRQRYSQQCHQPEAV